MNIELLIGTWLLTGSISLNAQIKFIGDEPDPNGVENWLNGNSNNLIAQVEATEGLTPILFEHDYAQPYIYYFIFNFIFDYDTQVCSCSKQY